MTKFLIALALSTLIYVPHITATDWAGIVKQVEHSVVYVETEEGSCTGFVIDQTRHYVLTAAHCAGKEVWVDRVRASIISKDTKEDLLVLEAKEIDPSLPALKLAAKNPERGEEVMSCGYGMGLERPFFRQAHVQDDATMIPEIGGPFISLDSAFVGGQSGGPVVNHAGQVSLIVQRASNTVGIGVGAQVIRERMGRFFSKAQ